MYEEVANEGGKKPVDMLDVAVKTDDPEVNKHVPFITETVNGYSVKCGKTAFHDGSPAHHLIFIELIVDDVFYYRKYLKTDEKPIVDFVVQKGSSVKAIAFCNLHGL